MLHDLCGILVNRYLEGAAVHTEWFLQFSEVAMCQSNLSYSADMSLLHRLLGSTWGMQKIPDYKISKFTFKLDISTHETPTGAAEICPLEFEGGDFGTLKLKPEAEAARPKSEAEIGRKAAMTVRCQISNSKTSCKAGRICYE
jgi:hypothetical protein